MHVIQFTWNFRVAISYCQNDRDLLQIQSSLAKQSSPNHFVKHHRKFGCIFSLWCTLLMRSWMRNPNERKDSMSLMESKPLETQNGHGFEVRLLEELQQSTNFSVGDFSDFFYPTIPVPISWLVLVKSVKFAAWLLSDHPKNSCSTSPQLSWKKVRQSPFSPHHNDLHTFCNSPSHVGHSLKPSPTTSRFKASPKTWLPQWSRRNPKRTGLHKKSKWIHGSRAEKESKSWTNDKVEKGQWMTKWVVAILHQVSGS